MIPRRPERGPAFGPRRSVASRILFLHLPKAGGTSIIRALRLAMGPRHLLRPTTQFMLLVAASDEMAAAASMTRRQARDVLLRYALADERARFVGGHFWFHEAIFAAWDPPWQPVTLLRDPVELWSSNHDYNLGSKRGTQRISLPLAEFVESDRAAMLAVDQVRRLLPATSEADPRSEAGRHRGDRQPPPIRTGRRARGARSVRRRLRAAIGLRPSFGRRNTGVAPLNGDPSRSSCGSGSPSCVRRAGGSTRRLDLSRAEPGHRPRGSGTRGWRRHQRRQEHRAGPQLGWPGERVERGVQPEEERPAR